MEQYKKIKDLSKQLENYSSSEDINSLIQISETIDLEIQTIIKIIKENSQNGKLQEYLQTSLVKKTTSLQELSSTLKSLVESSPGREKNQYTDLFTTVKEEVVQISNLLEEIKENKDEGSRSSSDLQDLMKTLQETVLQLENYKTEIDQEGRLTELSISKLLAEIEKIRRAKDKLETTDFQEDLNQEEKSTIQQTNTKTNTILAQLISYADNSKQTGNWDRKGKFQTNLKILSLYHKL